MEGLFPDAVAPPEEPEERRLFLLDGTALAYRAFHAMSRSGLTDRNGGRVVLVPLLEGRSSTDIIERIRGGK